jgi:hypothetical protein
VLAVDSDNANTALHNAARNGRLWALHLLLEWALVMQDVPEDAFQRWLNVRRTHTQSTD